MSSNNFIKIDWSSASQHSFIQLGDIITSQKNSDNLLHNTESIHELTTEEIFILDIDDIYSFTYSTLYYEEPELEDTYSIEDYVKSLCNDTAVEEITLRRDYTPLPSAPPSPLVTQEVIVRRDNTSSPLPFASPSDIQVKVSQEKVISERDNLASPFPSSLPDVVNTPVDTSPPPLEIISSHL
ncbi:unnamed protein product [Rhizophagus irregularis]|nr:unnamed protein product [Rhizophagus irregularis]